MIGFVYDFSDPDALDKLESTIIQVNATVKCKDEATRKQDAQDAIQAKIKLELIEKMEVHGNDKLKKMLVKSTAQKLAVPKSSKTTKVDKFTSRIYLIGVRVDPNGENVIPIEKLEEFCKKWKINLEFHIFDEYGDAQEFLKIIAADWYAFDKDEHFGLNRNVDIYKRFLEFDKSIKPEEIDEESLMLQI